MSDDNIIQLDDFRIAGARVGDTILVTLHCGKIERVLLDAVLEYGIEGYEIDLLKKPLSFYPFASVLKITKFVND